MSSVFHQRCVSSWLRAVPAARSPSAALDPSTSGFGVTNLSVFNSVCHYKDSVLQRQYSILDCISVCSVVFVLIVYQKCLSAVLHLSICGQHFGAKKCSLVILLGLGRAASAAAAATSMI